MIPILTQGLVFDDSGFAKGSGFHRSHIDKDFGFDGSGFEKDFGFEIFGEKEFAHCQFTSVFHKLYYLCFL